MSRYSNDITTNKSTVEINDIIIDFMKRFGFKDTKYESREDVWQKGIGILAAPQFIKIIPSQGKAHIEAWIKFALLPGVYLFEMGLTGFFGFAVKLILKSRVKELEKLIMDK